LPSAAQLTIRNQLELSLAASSCAGSGGTPPIDPPINASPMMQSNASKPDEAVITPYWAVGSSSVVVLVLAAVPAAAVVAALKLPNRSTSVTI
jgi:hypothetical protein